MKRLLFAAVAVMLISACGRTPVYPEAPSKADAVTIKLEDLWGPEPLFFTFIHEGHKINYLVVRTKSGIESYFDACAKCYTKKRGYSYSHGYVFCRACDVQYGQDELKNGIGSCYPLKLPGRVENGFYMIDKKDLIKGKKYFSLSTYD